MYGIINKTNVQNVKITMIDKLLSLLAPHLCYMCRKSGTLLCDNCKYDIIQEASDGCILCAVPTGRSGVCGDCRPPFSRAWYVGDRTDQLRRLIDDYKFNRVQAASEVLAALLFERIGRLPEDCIIVPVPSSPAHVRQRGYEHIKLVADQLAKLNKCSMETLLTRRSYSVQTGKTRKEREDQARTAFGTRGECRDKTILLVDDTVTTGATVKAAAEQLQKAGAADVWVAAVARQPLD